MSIFFADLPKILFPSPLLRISNGIAFMPGPYAENLMKVLPDKVAGSLMITNVIALLITCTVHIYSHDYII